MVYMIFRVAFDARKEYSIETSSTCVWANLAPSEPSATLPLDLLLETTTVWTGSTHQPSAAWKAEFRPLRYVLSHVSLAFSQPDGGLISVLLPLWHFELGLSKYLREQHRGTALPRSASNLENGKMPHWLCGLRLHCPQTPIFRLRLVLPPSFDGLQPWQHFACSVLPVGKVLKVSTRGLHLSDYWWFLSCLFEKASVCGNPIIVHPQIERSWNPGHYF